MSQQQREKAWQAVLETEQAFGLPRMNGDSTARYERASEVRRVQEFHSTLSSLSPQTNKGLFQMYLDYLQLFPDPLSWTGGWQQTQWIRPEAQKKGREFLALQQLKAQFNTVLPLEHRQTYTFSYLAQKDARVFREVSLPFLEEWKDLELLIAPHESLVLSIRYYDDEVEQRAPWTQTQDHWYYLIGNRVHLHVLWTATRSSYRYLDQYQTDLRTRRAFHVIATPPSWKTLQAVLKPSWRMGDGEKTGRVSWLIFHPENDAMLRPLRTTEDLHLLQK